MVGDDMVVTFAAAFVITYLIFLYILERWNNG